MAIDLVLDPARLRTYVLEDWGQILLDRPAWRASRRGMPSWPDGR